MTLLHNNAHALARCPRMKRMNITVGSRTVGGVVVTGWELMTINDQMLGPRR